MRKAIAIVTVLAITLLIGTLTAVSDSQAASRPLSQDESTGPYNPGIPRD